MKKCLIGLLSVLLVLASVFGASMKGPKDRRPGGRPGGGSDRVLWV